MKMIVKICLSVSFVCWLATVTAQTNAAAFSNLLVKGIRGSAVTVTINGAESGKVLAGLSKLIAISKPGNLQLALLDEQGNRFDTAILITDKDANKTITIRFPDRNTQAPLVEAADEKDTDGDGVPDYKDKELFTQKNCLPVNNQGVGSCPDPSVRDLYNMVLALQARIESFEKQGKSGSVLSTLGASNKMAIDSSRQILNEMKTFVLQMQQQVAKARNEAQEAEQASTKAQMEAQQADLASSKAQMEANEADQAASKAEMKAQEATQAADRAKKAAETAEKIITKPTGNEMGSLEKDTKKNTRIDPIVQAGRKSNSKETKK
jgi:hypothetical protein